MPRSETARFYVLPRDRVDELKEATRPLLRTRAAIDAVLTSLTQLDVRYEASAHYIAFLTGYLYDEDVLRTTDTELTEDLASHHDGLFELYRPGGAVAAHDFDIPLLVADFHGAEPDEKIEDPAAAKGFQEAIRAVREALAATPDGSLLLLQTGSDL